MFINYNKRMAVKRKEAAMRKYKFEIDFPIGFGMNSHCISYRKCANDMEALVFAQMVVMANSNTPENSFCKIQDMDNDCIVANINARGDLL